MRAAASGVCMAWRSGIVSVDSACAPRSRPAIVPRQAVAAWRTPVSAPVALWRIQRPLTGLIMNCTPPSSSCVRVVARSPGVMFSQFDTAE